MDAYQEFYNLHHQRLFAYLLRTTGDYDLACDIVQEAFRRHFEFYNGQELSAPLVYRIARNALYDHYRRRGRWAEALPETVDEAASPEERTLIREEYRRALEALSELPMEDRDLMALVLGGDLSYVEIAELTGLTVANVKVRVHRVRRRLRDTLAKGEQAWNT